MEMASEGRPIFNGCSEVDPGEDTERGLQAVGLRAVWVVAVRSIRERILKGRRTLRSIQPAYSCSEVDPGEDTERFSPPALGGGGGGCSEVDPGEDTESRFSRSGSFPPVLLQ